MSSFRDIIARRRPAPPSEEPEVQPQQVAPTDAEPAETLLTEVSENSPSTLIDHPPAPPEVPQWDLEPPMPTMDGDSLDLSGLADAAPVPDIPEAPAPKRRKVWDFDADDAGPVGDDHAAPPPDAVEEKPPVPVLQVVAPDPVAAVPPAAAPAPRQGGRVKTRLLGFHSDSAEADVFTKEVAPAAPNSVKFPVGWVVIVDGPGRGTAFALAPGLSTLGRGSDQTIPIDFGDDCISRNTHASIAYDDEENQVLIGHGGKSNLVRLNELPLVSATELQNGDQFRIGKTTLRFVALCGGDFRWTGLADND